MEKPVKTKKTKKRTTPQPMLTIRHSGAGRLSKTKTGLELRLCSSAAEAQAAGLSSKRASPLFTTAKKLCELEFALKNPKGLEGIFDPYWIVYCVDTGCEGSAEEDQMCNCVLLSTADDDPAKDKHPRDEGSGEVPVEEGRWYKCSCACGYSD